MVAEDAVKTEGDGEAKQSVKLEKLKQEIKDDEGTDDMAFLDDLERESKEYNKVCGQDQSSSEMMSQI